MKWIAVYCLDEIYYLKRSELASEWESTESLPNGGVSNGSETPPLVEDEASFQNTLKSRMHKYVVMDPDCMNGCADENQ